MKLRQLNIGIFLLFAFLTVPALKAQDGLRGAFTSGARTSHGLIMPSPQIAAADFDNDQKPDGALLREAGLLNGERAFRIEFHVTSGENQAISFFSKEAGLSISALDVNSDGAPDIVIEKEFTHERLQVYLNDGHGDFHRARTQDFPSSDPASPSWGTRLNQPTAIFGLPVTRGSELNAVQHVAFIRQRRSASARLWCGELLIQSPTRAPSSSRAPPTLSL
jgi:hypothetical protein